MRQHHASASRFPSGPRPHPQAGYTLLELMIVLAVLASIAGISWPALMRPWSRSLAQQAAQQLSEQLLDARTRAVEQSRVYRLRWRPGTGDFQIDAPFADSMDAPPQGAAEPAATLRDPQGDTAGGEPRDTARDNDGRTPAGLSAAAGASSLDTTTPTLPPRPVAYQLSQQLDNGVRFPASQPRRLNGQEATLPALAPESAAPNNPLVAAMPAGDPSAGIVTVEWSEPIWFYPDGRTSNGRWTLVSDDGYEVDVALRGLTGTVRIGRVRPAPRDQSLDELAPDEAEAAETTRGELPGRSPDASSPARSPALGNRLVP